MKAMMISFMMSLCLKVLSTSMIMIVLKSFNESSDAKWKTIRIQCQYHRVARVIVEIEIDNDQLLKIYDWSNWHFSSFVRDVDYESFI
jgi:hypothetical protein